MREVIGLSHNTSTSIGTSIRMRCPTAPEELPFRCKRMHRQRKIQSQNLKSEIPKVSRNLKL